MRFAAVSSLWLASQVSVHAAIYNSTSRFLASCTTENGVDYVGNDIANVPATASSECCGKCAAQSGCKAFTWTNYNGGTCWLKSGKGATKSDSGAISGTTSQAQCSAFETDVDYIGNDVGNVSNVASGDCCAKCAAFSGCNAFTWTNYNSGTCWLKSGKGAFKSSSGAISGTLASATRSCTSTEQGVDYIGNDIASVPGADVSECCSKCSARPDCGAFSWTSYQSGTCWLKSGKGATKSDPTVISAVVGAGAAGPTPAPTPPPPPRPTTKPPTSHVQWQIRAMQKPARAVNLGGWLVMEYWMTFTSPAWKGVSEDDANGGEYVAMQKLGKQVGTAQFEAHRSTWITEKDIQEIAAAGLNTVRVPVGYWIVNDDPSTVSTETSRVYAPGGLKYLDKLVNDWAVKYNIAVILSLHAHQGSQNGNDHSAPTKLRVKDWDKSQANVENSLQFATFLAARYKNSEAFLGMNLMNEPSVPTSYDVLLGYYKEAYRRIRATGNDCIIAVSPMVEQQGVPTMMDFMRSSEYYNVWHEWHPYFKWGFEGQNEKQIIAAATAYPSHSLNKWTGNPIFLGEWSLGSPEDSAPFKDRELLKQYAAAELKSFMAAPAGWSFWAWRNDQEVTTGNQGTLSGWCMRQLLRAGIFSVPK